MYKVLLVDDEYMILQGLKMIIDWESLGFEVTATAKTGQEALECLSKQKIDVMISDVNMPGMTGLELIETAKKDYPNLQTLILSGFQEFSYVKKAIELEAKAYLLKPVDKTELQAKMRNHKQSLDAQKAESVRQSSYRESLVSLWLADELNEKDYLQLVDEAAKKDISGYTVLYLECKNWCQDLEDFFVASQQPFCIRRDAEKKSYIAILLGERNHIKTFVSHLQEEFAEEVKQTILGETVTEWENVYESYHQVRRSLFYNSEISSATIKSNSKIEMPESRLQFFSFNKALMIGDEPTIISKLEEIFEEMKALKFSPEDVKHVSFLLFSDIYRQFPILDQLTYQAMLHAIHESQFIDEILSELKKVLQLTSRNQHPQKRYSDLVSQTVQCIQKQYKEELTLKVVADRLHVNGVYLGQCFKHETERSFAQYLNQVRIQKAQQLLLYSSLTINEIAYDTGYNTNHYFIKMFKKLNGLSPKEFRDQYKDKYQAIEVGQE